MNKPENNRAAQARQRPIGLRIDPYDLYLEQFK